MKVERNNVFETASSSVHTLCFSNKKYESNLIPSHDGKIHVYCYDYWSDDNSSFITQMEKLSYLATQSICHDGFEKLDTLRNDNISSDYMTKYLFDAIEEVTGYEMVIDHISEASNNHQIYGDLLYNWYPDDEVVKNSIKEIVFNDRVSILIGRD